MTDLIDEIQDRVRDLRDSDTHVCPADKNDFAECSCDSYDRVIDLLEDLKKKTNNLYEQVQGTH